MSVIPLYKSRKTRNCAICQCQRFLQKNAPKSRYRLFVDNEENSETSVNELEDVLEEINSSIIEVYLQVYGVAVDPCNCIFRRYSTSRMLFS